MIDFTPPPHVEEKVSAIHRFIADDLTPIERDLAEHLANEHHKGSSGATAFIVENTAPGLTIGRTYRTIM